MKKARMKRTKFKRDEDRALFGDRHVRLSKRDSLHVLAVLENPPKPNAKLLAAARAILNNESRRVRGGDVDSAIGASKKHSV